MVHQEARYLEVLKIVKKQVYVQVGSSNVELLQTNDNSVAS